ncbi:uncharacterized protein LOC115090361 isoform X2 [Rhinatrema bivittatum]|uniref:uncharacterized protein LOC115090361 isoform X2 n=1 Tax=Rhinatrema bivittatum TaxID=194408 RepID=UPI0011284DE0|nr:uncharacterized protein LOC115090361 isoform X2 [Rhinatrema bivittatum]
MLYRRVDWCLAFRLFSIARRSTLFHFQQFQRAKNAIVMGNVGDAGKELQKRTAEKQKLPQVEREAGGQKKQTGPSSSQAPPKRIKWSTT